MSNTLNSNGFDTGSNYRFGDKLMKPSFARSLFDLSHLSTTTIPNAGVVFPISLWRTVPSDEFDISVRSLIRVLPQVVPLYSRQRLYVYAFYSRMGDLWSNWDVFARRGNDGNTIKTIPTFNADNVKDGTATVAPNSVFDMLGLPIGSTVSDFYGKVSCLPAMMLTRIWRDYFINKNFWIADKTILPDDDSRFRLNDDGKLESAIDDSRTFVWDFAGTTDIFPDYDTETETQFNMSQFCHNYPDDYFTSALPWQQRGTAPTLNLGSLSLSDVASGLSVSAGSDLFKVSTLPSGSPSAGTHNYNLGLNGFLSTDVSGDWASAYVVNSISSARLAVPSTDYLSSSAKSSLATEYNKQFNDWLASGLVSGSGSVPVSASVTLNDIRQLAISQLELERMARTDGSYEEFGKTFFGVSSKNAIDFKPVFIGGSYTALSFTEVLQTSETTESSDLGAYAGHGIGVDNSGYLGHCYCDDYGYIMILGCIMPDVYYSQGVEKHWTELMQSDLLLPDRTKLGMQPILNQELYFQPYSVVDDDGNPVNENLWAYQDIFDDYRYMANRIHGQIADSTKESFYPYTQSRKFSQLPNWSRQFSNAYNVRKDYLAAPVEDAYTAQFSIDVRAVRPLPYQAVPAQIIN